MFTVEFLHFYDLFLETSFKKQKEENKKANGFSSTFSLKHNCYFKVPLAEEKGFEIFK